MPAYLKLGDIKGEITEQGHKDWIKIETMSAPIFRSIPEGARDMQRARAQTTLGDIVLVRELDKSSVKLAEACANGKVITGPNTEIHFCTTINNKEEPYLKYKLSDVIITSYSFHGNSKGDPLPTEGVTLGYTEIEWTYVLIDPKTGEPKGNIPAKYNLASAKS